MGELLDVGRGVGVIVWLGVCAPEPLAVALIVLVADILCVRLGEGVNEPVGLGLGLPVELALSD